MTMTTALWKHPHRFLFVLIVFLASSQLRLLHIWNNRYNLQDTSRGYSSFGLSPPPLLRHSSYQQDTFRLPHHQEPRKYRFSSHIHQSSSFFLAVGVLSTAQTPTPRHWIRQTWAAAPHNATVLFLVGGNWTRQLQHEMDTHRDLLWIGTPENYRGISEKVLGFYAMAHHHLQATYLLKTDDDTFVRLKDLQHYLTNLQTTPKLYMGLCEKGGSIARNASSKWYVPESLYQPNRWPPYALGNGYILSQSLVACIVKRNLVQNTSQGVIPIEDAYTGILAKNCRATCTNQDRLGADYWDRMVLEGILDHPQYERRQRYRPRLAKTMALERAQDYLLMHHVKNWTVMQQLHQETCCRPLQQDDPSCVHVDKSICNTTTFQTNWTMAKE